MVCDHGLRPRRLSSQIWVIPVRGFCITTSSAQPVETPATTIRATYRSIGVHRTRFRSERGAAPSEKCEFGFIDGPLIRFGFLIARHQLRRSLMPCYFFKSARKLGVVIMPICACLETIVALPGEPEAP